eukprot:jgi/Ulvmu1/1447/UM011_0177.1
MAAPRQKFASGMNDGMMCDDQVHCWCCKALIVVPSVDGVPADVFKCGWCGAINPKHGRYSDSAHVPKPEKAESLAKHISTSRIGRCCDRAETCLESALCCHCPDWLVQALCLLIVAFTSGLIASIGVFGVYPVLYSICSSKIMFALNASFAFFLEANIFFNYYTAVFRNAGRVGDFFDLKLVPPARSSFDDFTFCDRCDKPKPPNTHHCSVCNTCVVEMDHHCPYINNCVGRGNLRHFLLFLFWVTVAMLYALPVMGLCVFAHRTQIISVMSYGKALQRHRQDRLIAPFRMIVALASMPTTPFIALLLSVLCLMVLIMVGMLCARHWLLAAHGNTYVGRLKGEKVAEGGTASRLTATESIHL